MKNSNQNSALRRNTISLFVKLLLLLGISCFILGKQVHAKILEESGNITSLSSSLFDEAVNPSVRAGQTLKDSVGLLKMLESGEAFLTKAVYFKNGDPFCFMDVSGQEDMVPQFATSAPRDFPSAIASTQILPKCTESEEIQLAYNIQNFVPEGTQIVLAPYLIVGLGACAVGIIEEVAEIDWGNNSLGLKYGTFTSLIALTGAGTAGDTSVSRTWKGLRVAGARVLGGVALGYLACGKVAGYFVEKWEKRDRLMEQEAE